MDAKKSGTRFTLQFNGSDPDHLHVAELLNERGRRKASYIVDAILFYENSGSPVLRSERIDEKTIEAVVTRILNNKNISKNFEINTSKTAVKNIKPANDPVDSEFNVAAEKLGKSGMDSIAKAMAAFRGK